jgi:hypothetical protein
MFCCICETWSAAVTGHRKRAPRHRAWQRHIVAPVWGGECCTQGFSISLHRLGAWGHAEGTCYVGPWSSDAVCLGSVARREKWIRAPRTSLYLWPMALSREHGCLAECGHTPVPVSRLPVVGPRYPEPTTLSQQAWRSTAVWTAPWSYARSASAPRCQGRGAGTRVHHQRGA